MEYEYWKVYLPNNAWKRPASVEKYVHVEAKNITFHELRLARLNRIDNIRGLLYYKNFDDIPSHYLNLYFRSNFKLNH